MSNTPYRDAMKKDNALSGHIKDCGNDLTAICHELSREAGWWSDADLPANGEIPRRVTAEKLLLIHTEISEATEGLRKGLPDDKLPEYDMFAVELADALIRICDLAGAHRIDLGRVIAEKLLYNVNREDHKPEVRAAEGGKSF